MHLRLLSGTVTSSFFEPSRKSRERTLSFISIHFNLAIHKHSFTFIKSNKSKSVLDKYFLTSLTF
jgi:hypothetical protein